MQNDDLEKFHSILDALPRPIAQATLYPAWSEAEEAATDGTTRPVIAADALKRVPQTDGFRNGIANDGDGNSYTGEEVRDLLSRAGFEA